MKDWKYKRGIKLDKIIVDKQDVRLDVYITEKYKDLSRTMVQKLIEEGNIKVNGNIKKLSYKCNNKSIKRCI